MDMDLKHYILDEAHTPVVTDLTTWAVWMRDATRWRVKSEEVQGAHLSTIFLGLDHRYGAGPPLLFETMVLGGPLDQEQERCSTWAEAEAQHEAMKQRILAA